MKKKHLGREKSSSQPLEELSYFIETYCTSCSTNNVEIIIIMNTKSCDLSGYSGYTVYKVNCKADLLSKLMKINLQICQTYSGWV